MTEPHQPPERTDAHEPPEIDFVLRAAVLEIEAHASEAGWDEPARLYALVPTSDLVVREPQLAAAMGLDAVTAAGTLTPVEQDTVPVDRPLEDVLGEILWPAEVFGCAAVVERVMLPPAAEEGLPEDPAEAQRVAAEHPDREEVRIVAGATRAGSTYCALRLRSHDDPQAVVEGPDVVPALLQLVRSTLEQ